MATNTPPIDEEEIVLDFADVPLSDLIPAGDYQAEIISAVPGKSKNSGSYKMDLRWRITEGDMTNRQVLHSLSFHPNAMSMAKQTMKALGFDVSGKVTLTPADWVGLNATIHVDVEHSKNNDPATGEPYPDRNRVKRVKRAANVADLFDEAPF